jgi:hypothetical protein
MKQYLVAEAVDNETGYLTYHEPDIIEAETIKEAAQKYNVKHKCSYFYGSTLGEVADLAAVRRELERGICDVVDLYRTGAIVAPER